MRFVTKYTWHDLKDPAVDPYPADDVKRVVKQIKPYLIGKTLNKIIVSGAMSGSGINENETIHDFEKRVNAEEVSKGKPSWQIRQHIDWGNNIVFVIDNNQFEIKMWANDKHIISMNNESVGSHYNSKTAILKSNDPDLTIKRKRLLRTETIRNIKRERELNIATYDDYVDISCCYGNDIIRQKLKEISVETEETTDDNNQEIEVLIGIIIVLENGRKLYVSSPIDWPELEIVE